MAPLAALPSGAAFEPLAHSKPCHVALREAIEKIENQITRIEFLEVQEQLPRPESEGSINMAKKKSTDSKEEPAKLTVRRADAQEKIEMQLGKGRKLRETDPASEDTLKQCRQQYYRWDEYNFELLQRIFSNESVARDYHGYSFGGLDAVSSKSWDWTL